MKEAGNGAMTRGSVGQAAPSHTPGPWVVTQLARINARSVVVDADEGRRRIAKIALSATLPETDQANARLIAAAPELLSALEGLLDHHHVVARAAGDSPGDPDQAPEVIAARAALAKAKGA